jgi:radical SAM protein with 4Fe4S-binding SPASM domain
MAQIGSKAWQVQITVAMGRAADRPDLLLQPYHLLELFPLMVWIKQNILEPSGIRLIPGNNFGYFGPYEEILRYGGDLGSHWSGCPAGKWSLGIEADGKIKGCPSLATKDYTGGNIRERSLSDLVSNAPEINHIKDRTRDDLWGFCKGCYYADVCKGGCTWTAHSLLGRAGNNPYCIHRAVELEQRGLRERVVKVESAPGKSFDRGRFEIVEEAMPQDLDDSILGVDTKKVVAMRSNDTGAWTPEEIRERLSKS